ncbi:response regulator [Flavobacterium phragmitis]|uniref:Two-component system, cell cycle response regulator n=1 Tax=Flavobacterium phragmitis TaxID=739143 RepID=A0A1I1LQ36_9FLAO|nr:response regulator [Flavobacterium phragmitis]SFC75347.1 two-component system, cell cycle response regulator [Flavobacterium phragmitis]
MNRNGEIIVIEDDEDDRLMLGEIFESLDIPSKVTYFSDPTKVMGYLSGTKVKPFLILSDINMPGLNGYQLREKILSDGELEKKCVPYIFLSTSKAPLDVEKAFSYPIHGYFEKKFDFKEYQNIISGIVQYGKNSSTLNL